MDGSGAEPPGCHLGLLCTPIFRIIATNNPQDLFFFIVKPQQPLTYLTIYIYIYIYIISRSVHSSVLVFLHKQKNSYNSRLSKINTIKIELQNKYSIQRKTFCGDFSGCTCGRVGGREAGGTGGCECQLLGPLLQPPHGSQGTGL